MYQITIQKDRQQEKRLVHESETDILDVMDQLRSEGYTIIYLCYIKNEIQRTTPVSTRSI